MYLQHELLNDLNSVRVLTGNLLDLSEVLLSGEYGEDGLLNHFDNLPKKVKTMLFTSSELKHEATRLTYNQLCGENYLSLGDTTLRKLISNALNKGVALEEFVKYTPYGDHNKDEASLDTLLGLLFRENGMQYEQTGNDLMILNGLNTYSIKTMNHGINDTEGDLQSKSREVYSKILKSLILSAFKLDVEAQSELVSLPEINIKYKRLPVITRIGEKSDVILYKYLINQILNSYSHEKVQDVKLGKISETLEKENGSYYSMLLNSYLKEISNILEEYVSSNTAFSGNVIQNVRAIEKRYHLTMGLEPKYNVDLEYLRDFSYASLLASNRVQEDITKISLDRLGVYSSEEKLELNQRSSSVALSSMILIAEITEFSSKSQPECSLNRISELTTSLICDLYVLKEHIKQMTSNNKETNVPN